MCNNGSMFAQKPEPIHLCSVSSAGEWDETGNAPAVQWQRVGCHLARSYWRAD